MSASNVPPETGSRMPQAGAAAPAPEFVIELRLTNDRDRLVVALQAHTADSRVGDALTHQARQHFQGRCVPALRRFAGEWLTKDPAAAAFVNFQKQRTEVAGQVRSAAVRAAAAEAKVRHAVGAARDPAPELAAAEVDRAELRRLEEWLKRLDEEIDQRRPQIRAAQKAALREEVARLRREAQGTLADAAGRAIRAMGECEGGWAFLAACQEMLLVPVNAADDLVDVDVDG
jgi:hypothetical protein